MEIEDDEEPSVFESWNTQFQRKTKAAQSHGRPFPLREPKPRDGGRYQEN